ncbi:hypothetical protein ACQCX2_07720 [Propionibacteriaceae bacterium Y1700]|uniref:hypothetical protein n=1 Tax=Microlunatus sp. Y1700 TaxID=3418487 RepID=UPI003DA79722
MRVCEISGCVKKVKARGMCTKHYEQWRAEQPAPPCKIDGCGRRVWARGVCNAHYQRLRNGADMVKPITPHGRLGEFCDVPDCMREPIARGLCTPHWQRAHGRSAATGPVRPYRPRGQATARSTADLIEDIEWLIESGEPDVWSRLGLDCKPLTLVRRLYRAGRPDLGVIIERQALSRVAAA